MKKNIKFVTENGIDGMIARYSFPNRKCFDFFSQRTKILKFYWRLTLHTFASSAVLTHKLKLAKECNFSKTLLKFEIDSFYA